MGMRSGPGIRRRAAAAAVAVVLLAAGCGPEGSNATDRARVDELLAEPIISYQPRNADVVGPPAGTVSESANTQFATGGDNAASVGIEIPGGDRDQIVADYVDQLEQGSWSEIRVVCADDVNPLPTTRIGAARWKGYRAAVSIEVVDRSNYVDVFVVLRAPFHSEPKGDRPDTDTEPDLGCAAATL